ncbi:MAG: efflux RND transporter periplasmic adaptor subunit [Acidobacteriia bacterium]|nr:efflux RND transporter periplasmic adaptor subunit [Terriglobia bacterium]
MTAKKRWYTSKYLWITFVIIGAMGGFGTYEFFTVKADKPAYLLGTIERGDVVLQVACTGTLAAVTTVQVGTQVSGTVAELYADFNSEVKKGQLLAKLDPELFDTQVQQAEANVRTAEASLNDDKATIANAKANFEKAKVDVLNLQRKLNMQKRLWDQGLIARDDLDTAQANLDASVATEEAAQSQIDSCQARFKADEQRLGQAQASLDQAKVNLEHTIITSPISGTIISRSIDRGQTVAASFSSPTLFTIGEDLTKMQVSTNIDEADVGKIRTGMEATFAVDAYPGETFRGTISQIRLAATTVQNVVTYNAMIDVPNPQLKLKPGMTANVKILIDKADNVLKIPNSALRFKPGFSDQDMEAAFRLAGEEKYYAQLKALSAKAGGTLATPAGGMQMGLAPKGAGAGNRSASSGGAGNSQQPAANARPNQSARGRRVALWVLREDKSLRPIVVKLGLTDGVQTEIDPGKLTEGDKIVIGLENAQGRPAANAATRPPGFGGPMGGMGRGMR